MRITPSCTYLSYIQTYDELAKLQLLSVYQISKLYQLTLSFIGQTQQLKYILYSCLFFTIKTLQKPFLFFNTHLKFNITTTRGTFQGGRLTLRKYLMYSFLTELQFYLYPLFLTPKQDKNKYSFQSTFTLPILKISKGFPELEIFYMYFQHIQSFTITFHTTKPQYFQHLISKYYIPNFI